MWRITFRTNFIPLNILEHAHQNPFIALVYVEFKNIYNLYQVVYNRSRPQPKSLLAIKVDTQETYS